MQGNLKPRLLSVQTLVPNGTRVLDIGADHGILPISLLLSRRIVSAVLTDINKGPLEACKTRAIQTCKDRLCDLSFILSDGFHKVPAGCFDFVTICGMGGELIARILEEGGDKAKTAMALNPMSHHEKLREYLWSHGYRIKKEVFPREGKRTYLVLLAEYVGKNTSFTVCDAYLGKKRPQTEEFCAYATEVMKAAQKRREGALLSGNKAEARKANYVIAAAEKRITK